MKSTKSQPPPSGLFVSVKPLEKTDQEPRVVIHSYKKKQNCMRKEKNTFESSRSIRIHPASFAEKWPSQMTHSPLQKIRITRQPGQTALASRQRTLSPAAVETLQRASTLRASAPPSGVATGQRTTLPQRCHLQGAFFSFAAAAFFPTVVALTLLLLLSSLDAEKREVVFRRRDWLSGHRSRWLALGAGFALVGFEESVHHPTPALVHILPAWVEDGDKLQEAVADAVNDHRFDVLLVVENCLVALQAQLLALAEVMRVRLAQAAGKEEGVVGQRILFAAEHVYFGETLQDALRREQRREKVVSGEVRFVLLADVQEDHSSQELGWEDSVMELGDHAGHLDVGAELAWLCGDCGV
jgi:hypothetical protein